MSFDWQGHRGCRGLMPENTVAAMIKAIELGVTTLEMDTVITKDKQVILSHEPFFNHEITTKPHGSFVCERDERSLNIYKMTYEEVCRFDVGLKVHPRFPQQKKVKSIKPKLSDVIYSVEEYVAAEELSNRYYNIETKSNPSTDNTYHPEPAEFVELLVKVIKDHLIEQRTIIQSFDVRTLQYLNKHYPHIKTALLVEDVVPFEEHITELGFIPNIYSPEYILVDDLLITQCKEMGMQVIPWTVNDVAEMRKLKELGVNGIITDYPNLAF